ncbi:MAG: S41 family peptidase [Candidatus Eisenbacteria bacterium]|uniref:S41 family peptidase n=1 Tax=Eiseniibacteriota bacterium TaxID=2212470 RepID=A0A538T5W8_UNCEI|nr:MAG: S41 family peptidase [Candidatus Eisenbacteria bacterium]
MNRRQIIAVCVLVVALIAGTWAVARVQESNDNTYSNIERFIQVLTKVRDNYVEPVSSDKLMDAAIRGMLRTLDPYSQYLDKEEAERLETTTHGAFGGIGISIGMRDRWVTVIAPIEGTPAWKAGILGGDRISKIDDVSTEGLSLDDAMKKMRGEKGTHVKLTILREGRDKALDFDIVRDIIQIKSVPYSGMLSNGVGYVRLSNFSERSRQEMDAAFDKLEKLHPRGVIIDLRYNPGGLLSQAVEVAEEFTPRGKKIVYTRGRDSSQNRDFVSTADQTHNQYPIVILVNQWTASASEIVSGALQDLDLGLVVGRTTFGKGLVQTVIPLTRSVKGPKLKLTTAKYYTPSGRCIQKDEQLKDGALADDEDTDDGDKTDKTDATDAKKAKPEYRTEMGRVVYGGGGINPDVELVDVKLPRVIEDLEAKQVFFKYAVRYAARHKEPPADYALNSGIRDEFLQIMKDEKVEASPDSLAAAKRWVDGGIRRELGRRFGGEEEAYRIALEDDEQVKAAAALFDKAPTLPKLLALASELNKGKMTTQTSPLNSKSVR